MQNLSTALFVILCMAGVSYGWAMRGTILGHEKGGMLPGAILGLIFSFNMGFSIENIWLLPAIGAVGTYVGGVASIGQTFGLATRGKTKREIARGFVGLSLKGAQWLGIPGAFFGVALSMMSSDNYTLTDVAVLLAALIVLRFVGDLLINCPMDRNTGRHPRIYFSENRKEKFGGPLLFTIFALIYALCKGDGIAMTMTCAGVLAGMLGWPLSAVFMRYSMYSKSALVRKANAAGIVDNLKVKEFSFGALIGLFFAAGFLICRPDFDPAYVMPALGNNMLTYIWIAAFVLFEILHYISNRRPVTHEEIYDWEMRGLVAVDYAMLERRRADRLGGHPASLFQHIFWKHELDFQLMLWCVIPAVLVLSGNLLASRIVSGVLLLWALGYECITYDMNPYTPIGHAKVWSVLLTALSAAGLVLAFFGAPAKLLWAGYYIASYMTVTFVCGMLPALPKARLARGLRGKIEAFGSMSTVYAFNILLCVFMLIFMP